MSSLDQNRGNDREQIRCLGRESELEAIRVGLNQLKKRSLTVRIYTDSSYALGVLSLGWKAKKNRRLVNSIRNLLDEFDDLEIIKVPGHAGHKENERADRLARAAVEKRRTEITNI